MKLNEVIEPANQFMTNHYHIDAWLNRYLIKNYTIQPNGVVDVDGNVELMNNKLTHIPIQFGKVSGKFRCGENQLTSFHGCPYWIGQLLSCRANNITSLSGIHKLIKYCRMFSCNGNVTNILGLMLIDGLQNVLIDNDNMDKIMNNHLRGNRDIHACQEDLIEAGFGAQAKL